MQPDDGDPNRIVYIISVAFFAKISSDPAKLVYDMRAAFVTIRSAFCAGYSGLSDAFWSQKPAS